MKYLITGLILISNISTVFSQTTKVHSYTPESFIEAVRQSSYEIQIIRTEASAVRAVKMEARSALMPKVYARGQYRRNLKNQYLYINMPSWNASTGSLVESIQKYRINFNNDYSASLVLDQPLFNAQAIHGIKAAETYEKLSHNREQHSDSEFIKTARQTYLQYLFVDENYRLISTAEKLAQENCEVAKSNYEKGLITSFDHLQAQLNRQSLLSELKTLNSGRTALNNQLKAMLQLKATDSLHCTFNKENIPIPNIADSNSIFSRRADYQMLENNNHIQYINIKTARSQSLPQLNAAMFYNYSSAANNNLLDRNRNQTVAFGLNLNIPLFTGLYNRSRVNQSKIQHKISVLETEKARVDIMNEVTHLLSRLDELLGAIEQYRLQKETAEEALNLGKINLASGLMKQSDFNNTLSDYQMAALQYNQALFEYHATWIEWEHTLSLSNQ